MIVVKLECPSCAFSSREFLEGPSVHDGVFSLIQVNKKDRSWDFIDATLQSQAPPTAAHVTILKTHPGKEEMLAVRCPRCGRLPMMKKIVGLD